MLRLVAATLLLVITGLVHADAGLVSLESTHDVPTTTDKLVGALETKGIKVFAVIDHSAGANSIGDMLPPAQLVIFGSPKMGTPLMKCAPTVGIDLPLKALIWQDADGKVWLTYNAPSYLDSRHGLADCAKVLDKMQGVVTNFAATATQ